MEWAAAVLIDRWASRLPLPLGVNIRDRHAESHDAAFAAFAGTQPSTAQPFLQLDGAEAVRGYIYAAHCRIGGTPYVLGV